MKLYANDLLLLLALLAADSQMESLKVLWGDIVESKVDVLEPIVADENSRLDVIESHIDGISPTFLNSSSGSSITLSTAGNYRLEEDITANITISASYVTLDLNHHAIRGTLLITIAGDQVKVHNGYFLPPAPTSGTTNGVTTQATADRVIFENLIIFCADSTGIATRGRRGIVISGSYSQVRNCVVVSGSASAGSEATTTGAAGGEGILVGSAANYALIKNCVISTGHGGSAPASGGVGGAGGTGIFCDRSDFTEIINCTILGTGNGGDGDAGSGTGGAGGTGILLGTLSVDLAVRDCVIRNTGLGGSGATPGAAGKGIRNEVTGGSKGIALRNKAHNVTGVKFDLNNAGTEQGVQINPYPPTTTAINLYANTYVS